MRRALVAVLAGVALGVSLVGTAQAASGPDTWRNGFPPASAIPAILGNYSTAPEITAELAKSRWYVCANLQAKSTQGVATAVYATSPITQSGLRADARVYRSASAARTAFTAIKGGLSKCTGSRVQESEPGSGQKWVVTTSVGDVPSVAGDANGSVFVYEKAKPAKGSSMTQAEVVSSYSVLTLAGDTILVSDASVVGVSSLSTAQRDAVAAFTGEFTASWTKATG